MSVTAESAGGDISSLWASESASDFCEFNPNWNFTFQSTTFIYLFTFLFAGSDLISPGADAALSAVSQTGRALVAACLAVPTAPEYVALAFIGENTVQARAVGSADGRLCYCFVLKKAEINNLSERENI